jgi:molybdopterin/thiamine biosynthesis adenylyltransferase
MAELNKYDLERYDRRIRINGFGKLLKNKLLIYDGLSMEFQTIELRRNPTCSDCQTLPINKQ